MMKMLGTNLALLIVGMVVMIKVSWCLQIPDEERFNSKMLDRELVNYLTSLQYGQQLNNPCKYFIENSLQHTPMPKRNSELINSLLSLPKNMNDAGK